MTEHTHEVILPFEDRRKSDPNAPLFQLINQLHGVVQNLEQALQRSTDDQKKAVADVLDRAFPEGDPEGHRRYHEAAIAAAEEQRDFWKKLKLELFKWGLIGFIGWSVYAMWTSFLQGPHK